MKYFLPVIFLAFLFSSCTKDVVKPGLFVGHVQSVSLGQADNNLSMPVFADSKNGLIYSYGSGKIYKTVNGGDSWTMCFDSSTVTVSNIQYPNPDTAYFTIKNTTTNLAYCFRSTNGCTTWSQVFTLNRICYLDYYSGKNGYAFSAIPPSATMRLLKTTNAGTNWNTFSGTLPQSTYNPSSAQFLDANIGFATAGGFQFLTVNAGSSWLSIGRYAVASRFSRTGIAFRVDPNDHDLYKTTTFGNSWVKIRERTAGGDIETISFSDEGLVCASGERCLLISTDMGETWHYGLPDDGTDFSDFEFVGFTVIDNHTIIGAGGKNSSLVPNILKITF